MKDMESEKKLNQKIKSERLKLSCRLSSLKPQNKWTPRRGRK